MYKIIFIFAVLSAVFSLSSCGSSDSPFLSSDGSTTTGSGGGSSGSGGGTTPTDNPYSTVTLESKNQTLSGSGYGYIQTSDDSDTTVFIETFDPTGSNPTNLFQLFKLVIIPNQHDRVISQITSFANNTVDLNSFALAGLTRPVMSSDASQVTWLYDANPEGTNADGSNEIFSIDTDGTTQLQLTNTSFGDIPDIQPSITADGSLIAFVSNADLDTGNNLGLNYQVFTITNDVSRTITQITNTTMAVNRFVSVDISRDGSYIAFISTADLLGSNANQSSVIYTINIDGTNLVQQTPQSAPGFDSNVRELKMSNSQTIAFRSIEDYTGGNADNSMEIFSLSTSSSVIRQITTDWDRPGYLFQVLQGTERIEDQYDLSANGSYVVYVELNDGGFFDTRINVIAARTTTATVNTQLESEIVSLNGGLIMDKYVHYINTSTNADVTTFLTDMIFEKAILPGNDNIYSVEP